MELNEDRVIHRFIKNVSDYEEGGTYYNQIIPLNTQAYAIYNENKVCYVLGDGEHTYTQIRDGNGSVSSSKEYPVFSNSILSDIENKFNSVNTKISDAVAIEKARAEGAEQSINDGIVDETKRAALAEQVLQENINSEEQRARAIETNISLNLTSHLNSNLNPHGVTKAQVGLGNVDNTSDADKPVSTAVSQEIERLDSALNTETGRAEQAESNLNTAIENEKDRATEAENTLNQAIETEKNRATEQESTLSNNITSVRNDLSGEISSTDTRLSGEIATKANKTDVYTKEEIDNKLTGAFHYKGDVATVDDLPAENNEQGDVYNVGDSGSNYAWNGTSWDKLSETIDLTPYLTKSAASDTYTTKTFVNEQLNLKVNNTQLENYYTKTQTVDLIPTKVSELTNDSGYLTEHQSLDDYAKTADVNIELEKKLNITDAADTYATITNLSTHTSNTENPHNVTKEQLGLNEVDNTADLDKPISTATQAVLNNIENEVTGVKDLIPDTATTTNKLATNDDVQNAVNGLATEGYVDDAVANTSVPAQVEKKVNFLSDNFINEYDATEQIPVYIEEEATSVYNGSTFNGWYAGIGHPEHISKIEFTFRTRTDHPVSKVWASVIRLMRPITVDDFLREESNNWIKPYVSNITEFVEGCRDVLIFDNEENPIPGDGNVHKILWTLPETLVNTEGYDLITGYTCNNFITAGYVLKSTNIYNGPYCPWVHYTTWNEDTQRIGVPITDYVGTGPDIKKPFTCAGRSKEVNEGTDSTPAYPRWSMMQCKVFYDETTHHTEVADMSPHVSKAFDTMGLTESIDNAQTAAQLIGKKKVINCVPEYSSVDLTKYTKPLNLETTSENKKWGFINPASTFTGEFQVIGRIPANVRIDGFRIPFMIRDFANDTDESWKSSSYATIRLYEADGYPDTVVPGEDVTATSTADYKHYWQVDGLTSTNITQPARFCKVDKALTCNTNIAQEDGSNWGLYDFIFDEPYYNTNNRVLYLAVNLDVRFMRTQLIATSANQLANRINAQDGTDYTRLISWYSIERNLDAPDANPIPSKGWVNPMQWAYSVIQQEEVNTGSDLFNKFVDERTSDTTRQTAEEVATQTVEDYIARNPITVPANYEVRLAKKYYAVQGDKLQLFYDGLVKGISPSTNADIVINCSVGANYPRYWEFTPANDGSQNGKTYNFTLTVRDFQGHVISSGTTTIEVVAKPTFESPTKYNMLCFGDSLTSSGAWFAEGIRRIVGTETQNVSGPASLQVANLTLDSYGKKATLINTQRAYHEGYGGWTWASFLGTTGSGSTVNGIFVDLNTAVDWDLNTVQHSAWVDQNNKQWKLEDITDAGATIKFDRGTGNTDTQAKTTLPSQLTCSALSLTIATSDIATVTWESGNPFYDNETNSINFIAHAAELNHEPADIVSCLLTWNGGGASWNASGGFDHQYKITSHINNATTLLRKIHTDLPNAKIICCGIQLSSVTGGSGANYGANGGYADATGTNYYAFDYNQQLEALLNNEEFSQYCYYVDTKGQFDTVNLMPASDVPVNTRSSVTEKRGTNGVHPSMNGYYAIGDAFFRTLCKVLNVTKADYEGNNV